MDIRRITNESFQGLLNLEVLRLKRLNLTTIDSNAFQDLPKLTSISIWYSPLLKLDGMTQACCLSFISINDVTLHSLYFDSVASISSLKSLIISKGSLMHIFPEICNSTGKDKEQAIPFSDSDLVVNVSCSRYGKSARYNLSNLTLVDLNDNFIQFIHPAVLNCFPSLTKLILSNNLIEYLHEDSFSGLPHLEYLYLSYNKITFLPRRLFSPLHNLQALSLYSNYITFLSSESFYPTTTIGNWNEEFKYLPVRTLYLNNNNITSIGKNTFHKLVSIHSLRLDRNYIRHLDVETFHRLNNLSYLQLNYNELTHIQTSLFSALYNIYNLAIAHNKIYHLDRNAFANLTHLRSLQLNNNALSKLHPDLFCDLVNLRSLRLQFNNITSLPVDIFQSLSNLRMLLLFDNQILSIHPGTFLPMVSLINLNMDNNQVSNLTRELILVSTRSSFRQNPFVCSCDLFWLKGYTDLLPKTRLPFCNNVAKTPIVDYLDRFCCGLSGGRCKSGDTLVSTSEPAISKGHLTKYMYTIFGVSIAIFLIVLACIYFCGREKSQHVQ